MKPMINGENASKIYEDNPEFIKKRHETAKNVIHSLISKDGAYYIRNKNFEWKFEILQNRAKIRIYPVKERSYSTSN